MTIDIQDTEKAPLVIEESLLEITPDMLFEHVRTLLDDKDTIPIRSDSNLSFRRAASFVSVSREHPSDPSVVFHVESCVHKSSGEEVITVIAHERQKDGHITIQEWTARKTPGGPLFSSNILIRQVPKSEDVQSVLLLSLHEPYRMNFWKDKVIHTANRVKRRELFRMLTHGVKDEALSARMQEAQWAMDKLNTLESGREIQAHALERLTALGIREAAIRGYSHHRIDLLSDLFRMAQARSETLADQVDAFRMFGDEKLVDDADHLTPAYMATIESAFHLLYMSDSDRERLSRVLEHDETIHIATLTDIARRAYAMTADKLRHVGLVSPSEYAFAWLAFMRGDRAVLEELDSQAEEQMEREMVVSTLQRMGDDDQFRQSSWELWDGIVAEYLGETSDMPDLPTLTVIAGIMGSGKSEYAQEFVHKQKGVVNIDMDAIRMRLLESRGLDPQDQVNIEMVREELYRVTNMIYAAALDAGKSIVCQTSLTSLDWLVNEALVDAESAQMQTEFVYIARPPADSYVRTVRRHGRSVPLKEFRKSVRGFDNARELIGRRLFDAVHIIDYTPAAERRVGDVCQYGREEYEMLLAVARSHSDVLVESKNTDIPIHTD